MKRALMAFARTDIIAIPAPIRFDRPPVLELDELVPHISALQASYYAMHEWIGCAYYALRRCFPFSSFLSRQALCLRR